VSLCKFFLSAGCQIRWCSNIPFSVKDLVEAILDELNAVARGVLASVVVVGQGSFDRFLRKGSRRKNSCWSIWSVISRAPLAGAGAAVGSGGFPRDVDLNDDALVVGAQRAVGKVPENGPSDGEGRVLQTPQGLGVVNEGVHDAPLVERTERADAALRGRCGAAGPIGLMSGF
jgi:hypothetical protein